jgi:alpha,alpha-trehalase
MLLKYDKDLSLKIARNFFNSVFEGWKKHNVFYEKYDATMPGERGSGGEYTVQSGFGWTNGVTLQLLNIFKDSLIG